MAYIILFFASISVMFLNEKWDNAYEYVGYISNDLFVNPEA